MVSAVFSDSFFLVFWFFDTFMNFFSNSNNLLFTGSFLFIFTTISLIVGFKMTSSSPSSSSSLIDNKNIPGYLIKVSTRLGQISVRVVGQTTNKPIICLPGINPKLVDEWTKVGDEISQNGYVLYIINFHSNPRTVPSLTIGGISNEDVINVINDVMDFIQVKQVIIMGKSWGGGQAMNYAKEYPNRVIKICLVAPASSNSAVIKELGQGSFPIYLAWAKDDSVIWYSNTETWQSILGSKLTFQSSETGGHSILSSYSKSMIDFLQDK